MKKFFACLTSAAFFFGSSFAYSEDISNADLLKELKEMREIIKKQDARIGELETRLEKAESAAVPPAVAAPPGLCASLEEAITCSVDTELNKRDVRVLEEGYRIPGGLNIGADGTFVFQGTPNANNAGENEDDRFDGGWSTDIIISKDICYENGDKAYAFLSLETGQNDGITNELNVFSNVNYDLDTSGSVVNLTNLWYEHWLFGGQVGLRGGKIDTTAYTIDQNAFANDETSQFMSNIFRNNPIIEFPDDSGRVVGGNLMLKPGFAEYMELSAGYYNADGTWDNLFSHPFATAQLNFKPHELMGWDAEQWEGNYRVYWWTNARKHAKYIEPGGTDDDTDANKENYGFGLSCDQRLTDIYGVFARFGWQRPELIPMDSSPTLYLGWSTGAQMTGKYWKREDDVVGIAVGQVCPSGHYKNAGNPGYPETHLEAYYNFRVTKHLSISPDLQWIWDPRGVGRDEQGDDRSIFVYGMRVQLDF
jgi:carbohydrate-selective porin OprB